ncbi:MAG: ATP-binding cassette domain-containing protein [Alphaproteobacteria bacterium]|nr:ATP-binding cassette domain-containing protein [Alphaproteobacteria bacterium]
MKNFLSKIFRKRAQKPSPPPPPKQEPVQPPSVALRHEEGSDKVVFKDLVLYDAAGAPLIDFGSVTLAPGDRMMICGPAGCGKSAALSAMRNSWMLGGSGEITVPPEIRFVPQEEYFPDRTLFGIVCAPDPVARFTPEQVAQALTEAGLAEFVGAMDDTTKRGEYWKNTLSGGQKNKLSIAGIFLHAADTKVLIVDEITAALDAKSEAELYPRILERLRHGIVICVAHHAVLAPQHNVIATAADGKVSYTKTPPPALPKPPGP